MVCGIFAPVPASVARLIGIPLESAQRGGPPRVGRSANVRENFIAVGGHDQGNLLSAVNAAAW
jgi:hypothetical protein